MARDQHDLADAHDRVLVRAEHGVVRLGRDPDERGVEHVHEEEEEDRDAGDAVQHPRPHALAAPVESSAGNLRGGLRYRRCHAYSCRHSRPPCFISARPSLPRTPRGRSAPSYSAAASGRRRRCLNVSRRRDDPAPVASQTRNMRRDYPVGMAESIPGFYAVIPAGGIGSRLWPLSRADAPKFLHDLTGSGQTLLRDTWDRLAPLAGHGPDRRGDRAARTAPRSSGSCPTSPTTTSSSSPSRGTRPRPSASPPRSSPAASPTSIIGSFAADHVIRQVPHVRLGRAAGGGGRARGLHLHDRHPAFRAGGGIRLHQEGRRARGRRRPGGGASWSASSRSPTSTPRAST